MFLVRFRLLLDTHMTGLVLYGLPSPDAQALSSFALDKANIPHHLDAKMVRTPFSFKLAFMFRFVSHLA